MAKCSAETTKPCTFILIQLSQTLQETPVYLSVSCIGSAFNFYTGFSKA